MNITLAIDEQLVERAREKAGAQGKSLNDYIRESLQRLAGDDDVKARMARFRSISGKGNSNGWKFNREEIYDRS